MFIRKDAVTLAVLSLLASSGLAMADTTDITAPLSLKSTVTAAEAAPERAPLMSLLDKAGAAQTLDSYGLNIYGWLESGYTYNHRYNGTPITGRAFDHEYGNHYMLNQLVLRFERGVDSKKWDVGGMVELMYGSDAARIHSTGLGYNGSDATDDNTPTDDLAVANNHPILQFDIPQAYVTVNVPVGNGLLIKAGKMVTHFGTETIDPRSNAFYSHSYLFGLIPYTHTGVMAFYTLNDQWSIMLGASRGWDIALEDNNGCGIDVLGQITYTPNKTWNVVFNYGVGPENAGDNSHYRITINPIVNWQVNEKLKVSAEFLYNYDGGYNGDASAGISHAYGDTWGAAIYASYMVCESVTLNLRAEKAHTYLSTYNDGATTNFYEVTLGATIVPFPKDTLGKNLTIRPEVRYDWSEDAVYSASGDTWHDQLTFGCDIILKF